MRRALEERSSGRAFLQHLRICGGEPPDTGHFFETLKSARRLELITEVSRALARAVEGADGAAWEKLPELASTCMPATVIFTPLPHMTRATLATG